MPNEHDSFPLANAIASLRAEINEAARRAQALPSAERFKIKEVEVELTVAAEASKEGGAEVNWCIFKATAGLAAKDTVTHKVKFTLHMPLTEVGSDTKTR